MSFRIGQRIFGLLTTDEAVLALLGGSGFPPVTRLYPNRLPASTELTWPAATYTIITDAAQGSVDGFTSGLRWARVEIDCYSTEYEQAQAAADAVDDVLGSLTEEDFKSRKRLRRDLWDASGGPQGLHRVSTDFSVWVSDT